MGGGERGGSQSTRAGDSIFLACLQAVSVLLASLESSSLLVLVLVLENSVPASRTRSDRLSRRKRDADGRCSHDQIDSRPGLRLVSFEHEDEHEHEDD